jgi:hemerythrin
MDAAKLPQVEWTEDLEIGIPTIDEEHRTWIGLVADFCNASVEGRANDAVYSALVEALRYTETHLSHEEAFMMENGYPYLEDHKAQHELAKEEMHKFTTGYYSEEYIIKYFSDFLPNWLMFHINTSDRKMAEWILGRQKEEV